MEYLLTSDDRALQYQRDNSLFRSTSQTHVTSSYITNTCHIIMHHKHMAHHHTSQTHVTSSYITNTCHIIIHHKHMSHHHTSQTHVTSSYNTILCFVLHHHDKTILLFGADDRTHMQQMPYIAYDSYLICHMYHKYRI